MKTYLIALIISGLALVSFGESNTTAIKDRLGNDHAPSKELDVSAVKKVAEDVSKKAPLTEIKIDAKTPTTIDPKDAKEKTAEPKPAVTTPVKKIEEKPKKPSGPKLFGPQVMKDGKKFERIQPPEFNLFSSTFALILVLGIIFALYWAMRKFTNKVYNPKGNEIRVQSRQNLDGKNSLMLVRVHEEEFFLSTGPQGVTVIAKYALIDGKEVAFDTEGSEGEEISAIGNEL